MKIQYNYLITYSNIINNSEYSKVWTPIEETQGSSDKEKVPFNRRKPWAVASSEGGPVCMSPASRGIERQGRAKRGK